MRNLFIDDYMIAHIDGMRRVVNQPTKYSGNPVIKPDTPWEGYCSIYGTAMYDERENLFRIWYLTIPRDRGKQPLPHRGSLRAPHTTLAAYATSVDGIHWDKPNLDQFPYDNIAETNLLDIGRYNCEGISVLFDSLDPDPERRYKAFYWDHGSGGFQEREDGRMLCMPGPEDGTCVAFSPDGLRWTEYEGNPVISAYCDTNQTVIWDANIERYVAFSRFGFGRKVARSESVDFQNWSKPELVLDTDAADGKGTQFYGIAVDIYEGLYLGMLWVYREGIDGCIDTQLGCSRDGIHWERVGDRQTFLPLGEAGSWEDGMVRSAERIIVRNDQIFIYYCGVQGAHTGPKFPRVERQHLPAIGLATLRRDGFVSLDADSEPGFVLTKPFCLPSGDIHLNVDAQNGQVTLAICDTSGKPLPGLESSELITGDNLDAIVRWSNSENVLPVGKEVRLRIDATCAKLYSFWF